MDNFQKNKRIHDTRRLITEGKITGLLGARLGIAKAIALTECDRLPKGAPNINETPKDADVIRDNAKQIKESITSGEFKVKTHYGGLKGWLRTALALSKASKAAGAGNCMEQAAYVYCKLYKLGYFPIELITMEEVPKFHNHGMIVIGLPLSTKPKHRNPRYNQEYLDEYVNAPDAVICDPWMMMLLRKNGTETDGAYTIKEYIDFTGKYFRNWAITRLHRLEGA